MGLFGAIGRETKGAIRSLGYDLRRSKRFRRIGTMAVATMAGGVIAAGTLLQGDQVPGIPSMGDGDDADIIDGWFGIGAETAEQEAESPAAESTAPAGGADPDTGSASAEPESRSNGGSSPAGSPGLVPIGEGEPSGPSHEESGTVSPSPTDEPTTDEPTTDAPTTEAPTTAAPTDEPSPSESGAHADQAPRGFIAPTPQKGPIGG